MAPPEYSIVVPVYCSGDWLPELVERVASAMEAQGAYELILVNDHSPDGRTWPVIEDLARTNPPVRGIDLLYNAGQFRATLCGLEHAEGRFVITMDDDLQHPPEELPKLIAAMIQNPGLDCVIGEYVGKKHSIIRNAGSRFVRSIMNRLYDKPRDIVTTSLRIMTRDFARTVLLFRAAAPQLGPLVVSLSRKVKNVPVEHHSRSRGRSGYSLAYCIRETFQSVINASILPLRWFSVMGFATAAVAFTIGIVYLVRWWLVGSGVAGFTTLVLTISFFSGMILAGVGVLGEYVGRIIQEVTGMPRYEIRSMVGGRDDQAR